MNSNLKRKLLAGVFVPVLGLAVGTAVAQTSSGTSSTTTPPAAAPATPPAAAPMAAPAAGAFMWDSATFKRLDKNNDGKLSREEAQADASLRDHWTKLDSESKGSIEMSQFEDYGRKLSATPKSAGEAKK